jgi:hypothetical protein
MRQAVSDYQRANDASCLRVNEREIFLRDALSTKIVGNLGTAL